jgi:type IV pilus assembly protein PilB
LDIDTILQIIAEHLGTEVVNLSDREFPEEVLKAVPPETAKMHQCLPVAVYGSALQVALADPLNSSVVDELNFTTGKEIQLVVADPAQIEKAINKYYGQEGQGLADILREIGADQEIAQEVSQVAVGGTTVDLANLANETPIIRFVNLVLYQAVQDRASDIHFEPFEDEFKIRYRVDGALYEMAPPPKHLALPVTSRIKVMANLDISERRLPQDGRISMNLSGRQIDLRVSTLPTQFGESVVLRVLDRSATKLDIEALGFPKLIYDYMAEAIQQPNGILIVTGPTGSGKTTTLYSALKRINTIDSKLLTAEDPVEFDIEIAGGINEVWDSLSERPSLILRQDRCHHGGEIRDLETSQIAIQASLTGHLV